MSRSVPKTWNVTGVQPRPKQPPSEPANNAFWGFTRMTFKALKQRSPAWLRELIKGRVTPTCWSGAWRAATFFIATFIQTLPLTICTPMRSASSIKSA